MRRISKIRLNDMQKLTYALFLTGLLALLSLSTASRVMAEESLSGEVLVILASEEAGTIDSSLAPIPALRRPPFNAFRSMRVLSRSALALSTGKPVTVTLPNNRLLSLKLEARMPDGRSKVQVSIKRANEKDYLPLLEVIASPGEPFFVAGQKYQNGTLVIGVSVGKRSG
jgi:hypothetical protein